MNTLSISFLTYAGIGKGRDSLVIARLHHGIVSSYICSQRRMHFIIRIPFSRGVMSFVMECIAGEHTKVQLGSISRSSVSIQQ